MKNKDNKRRRKKPWYKPALKVLDSQKTFSGTNKAIPESITGSGVS